MEDAHKAGLINNNSAKGNCV